MLLKRGRDTEGTVAAHPPQPIPAPADSAVTRAELVEGRDVNGADEPVSKRARQDTQKEQGEQVPKGTNERIKGVASVKAE